MLLTVELMNGKVQVRLKASQVIGMLIQLMLRELEVGLLVALKHLEGRFPLPVFVAKLYKIENK